MPFRDERILNLPEASAASFHRLFAVREYRYLFSADVASVLGDQVAVVALAVLIYQRSGSALLTALGYSLVFLPWVVGGPILAALADRFPRRRVLTCCWLAQAVLVGLASIPAMPVAGLLGLMIVAAFLVPPFDSARGALLPTVLDDDRYSLAISVSQVTHQSGQLIGFVAGAAFVAAVSPRGALALDALTFLVGAALISWGLRRRCPSERTEQVRRSLWQETAEGLRAVLGHREVCSLLLLVWVVSMYAVVPESLAVPYASQLRLGVPAVGLLMAAAAAGVIVGSVSLTRLVRPDRRRMMMHPLALLGAIPLLGAAFHPGLVPSLGLFGLMGACTASLIPAQAAVMTALPEGLRGRVYGIAATGLAAAQLLATVSAGAAAELFPASTVVAGTGLIGMVAGGALHAADSSRRRAVVAQRMGDPSVPPRTTSVVETQHTSVEGLAPGSRATQQS